MNIFYYNVIIIIMNINYYYYAVKKCSGQDRGDRSGAYGPDGTMLCRILRLELPKYNLPRDTE